MLSLFGKVSGDKWISDNVRFYRSLGFFADLGKMSEKQLTEQIKKRMSKDAGPTSSCDGLDVILIDTKRVWKHDRVDFDRDTNFFIRAMDQWATISRGILRPLKVTVTRNYNESDRTLIQFQQDSMLYSMFVSLNGPNWLDNAVFDQLNQIFADSGFRFEVAEVDSEARVAMVLTPNEKAKLVKERNWRFVMPG